MSKNNKVELRDVIETDLLIFFHHQREPEAIEMAAFPSREETAFFKHWKKILANDAVIKKTILYNGNVAGNIVSFEQAGKREIGYWIGKQYWGKGIATSSLSDFIVQLKTRPLYAHVAKHNHASIRVLEKCGFRNIGDIQEFATLDNKTVEGYVFKLE